MLTLLMLALSDPAAMASSRTMIDRDPVVVSVPREDAQRCGNPLMQAQQGGARSMTLDRSLDDAQVRRYLLLDRSDQNNCPLPISYAVPDQRALGRNLMPAQPDVGVRPAPPAPCR